MPSRLESEPARSAQAFLGPARGVALALGAYALIAGVISFLGWPLDVPRLTDWLNDGVSIQPNAAVLVSLSAVGIICAQLHAWRTVTALGLVVAIAGVVILLQYFVGADFGFNHQLLFERSWGQTTTLTPGRVGPPASISFALIGTALVLLAQAAKRPARAALRRFVAIMGVVICALMTFALLGYVFEAREFFTIAWLTAIALQTATMLCAIGVALVVSVPERDPMRLFCEDSGAGKLARYTVPMLALLIPLTLWLRIQGYEKGLYDLGTGRALSALVLIIGTIAIAWPALRTLRRHEHALREADRRKDVFLATLAHELRNPLAPLRNAIELQRRAPKDPRIVEASRAIMERQVGQLSRLVDDLLDMSRISAGRLELQKQRVSLADVLSVAVETSAPAIDAAKHELTTRIPQNAIYLQADPTRLAQVFANLLNNSAKYTVAGGHIWLTAEDRGAEVVIVVRDTGVGMAQNELPRIFDLFTQFAPGPEHSKNGLGIGLSLAKGIVELHGGTIEATSSGIGQGSTFTVRLPTQTGEIRTADARVDDTPLPHVPRRRIVVVDDLQDAADSLAAMLRMMGHETCTAYDGVEAVQAVGAFKPDVVFLDIGLPKMNGYDAARKIRAQPEGDQ